MEFCKKGLAGGLEIDCTLEHGKAILEFRVKLQKAVAEEMLEQSIDAPAFCREGYLDIRMWDKEGRLVFCCCHPLACEEPAKGLMLHPHLWRGIKDPYLYEVQVSLMERRDYVADRVKTTYAFRNLEEISGKGWFLNGSPYQARAVEYEMPISDSVAGVSNQKALQIRLRRDMELIRDMGANTVCPIGERRNRELCKICDEMGLLVHRSEDSDIPRFHGTDSSLLTVREHIPTERYYFYKACWSEAPFVYINAESLRLQKNGYAQVTIYSNQRKVALYVDGVLFEFKTEGPDFLFQDIPVKKLPLMLTAEAGVCSMSYTGRPFTEFSQNHHFSMTFDAYNDIS